MKNFWKDINNIKKFISGKSLIVLFLDFDGTISPIKSTPKKAKIAPKTQELLKKLSVSPNILTVIISGRSLKDLRQKIPSEIVNLAANHGLEWVIEGKYNHVPLKSKYLRSLRLAKLSIKNLAESFPNIIIEDKKLGVAIHYRLLDNHQIIIFKTRFKSIIKKYTDANLLEVINGKKVFDIRPAVNWTKGNFAKSIVEKIVSQGRNPLVICIGDDTTDEDMFNKFDSGITIKVGKNNVSKSKYYVQNVDEVAKFLQLLIESSVV